MPQPGSILHAPSSHTQLIADSEWKWLDCPVLLKRQTLPTPLLVNGSLLPAQRRLSPPFQQLVHPAYYRDPSGASDIPFASDKRCIITPHDDIGPRPPLTARDITKTTPYSTPPLHHTASILPQFLDAQVTTPRWSRLLPPNLSPRGSRHTTLPFASLFLFVCLENPSLLLIIRKSVDLFMKPVRLVQAFAAD